MYTIKYTLNKMNTYYNLLKKIDEEPKLDYPQKNIMKDILPYLIDEHHNISAYSIWYQLGQRFIFP